MKNQKIENNSGIPPVIEGEEREVFIRSLGNQGDGIAKIDGYVIMIPNTEEGKVYKIQITKVFQRYAFGKVVE